MRFALTGKNVQLPDDLKSLIERRFDFALGRFSDVVERVNVAVDDENGPRGGPGKVCRVFVTTRGLGDVNIVERDSEVPAAASRAAERVGRAVARALVRRRTMPRYQRRRDQYDNELPQ
ncbi:MAG TPA: HPF/RaiA family ribosome-associated protein [Pirellulaceae bacterium]|nr:HPF/RaiA family ribosome-associated protein [Pirellulaceae bacterium]